MTASVQPQEIYQAIGAVLHPDPSLRQQAERYVNDAYKQPGCAAALLAVAAENQIEVGARSLPYRTMQDHAVCIVTVLLLSFVKAQHLWSRKLPPDC